MSKARSRAWDRKMRGHISTGVTNYSQAERTGSKAAPYKHSRRTLRKKRVERAMLDAQADFLQTMYAGADLTRVRALLDAHPLMTLTQARIQVLGEMALRGEETK